MSALAAIAARVARRPLASTAVRRSAATAAAAAGSAAAAAPAKLDHKRTVVEQTANPRPKRPLDQLLFGKTFSDHMLEAEWTKKEGWRAPRISAYHSLTLEPSCSVFHYGLECFEGMKAYVDAQNRVRLFRPEMNAKRLASSCQRLCLPQPEPAEVVQLIKQLVRVDKSWIPNKRGFSLYLRPTVIGTQPYIGVGPSESALLFVIASPVGPYFPEGFKPVRLYADEHNVRAWPGGAGGYKIGSNYSPAILPQVDAAAKGYTQVLWLLGPEHDMTEVGTMNMFVFLVNDAGEKELVTPPLDGTILPGVTRDSILALTRDWGEFKVSERRINMAEFARAAEAGRLIEAFGAGTAAIVSPIKAIAYKGKEIAVPLNPKDPSAGAGPLAQRLADTIMAIQYGEKAFRDWSVVVE